MRPSASRAGSRQARLWGGAPVLALLLALPAAGSGCTRAGGPAPAPVEAETTSPVRIPEPPPAPAEIALSEAREAIARGRIREAEIALERIPSLEGAQKVRGEAIYALAVLLARPGDPGRDVERASGLLERYLETGPPPDREAGARLILQLLELERRCGQQVEELRGRAAVSGSEAEDLRVALAQKEAELKRIKEILLGRSGGL